MTGDDVKSAAPELTELQLKCLERFWNRRSAKQIAAELGISEAWVNKNLLIARRVLDVATTSDAATIVFGGERGSIKNYYYQKTYLFSTDEPAEQVSAGSSGIPIELAASNRPLINTYGPVGIIAGIVLIAFLSIIGVTLLIDAGDGLYQLWKAAGY